MSFVEQKMSTVHKILQHPGEMIADEEGNFRPSYIVEVDDLAGVKPRALTCT